MRSSYRVCRLLIIGLAVLAVTGVTLAAAGPVIAAFAAMTGNGKDSHQALEDAPGMAVATMASLAVNVSVAVLPSRLIVVDEGEAIIEVYSNTGGLNYGYYALLVRELGQNGREHPLTENVLAQYLRLTD